MGRYMEKNTAQVCESPSDFEFRRNHRVLHMSSTRSLNAMDFGGNGSDVLAGSEGIGGHGSEVRQMDKRSRFRQVKRALQLTDVAIFAFCVVAGPIIFITALVRWLA